MYSKTVSVYLKIHSVCIGKYETLHVIPLNEINYIRTVVFCNTMFEMSRFTPGHGTHMWSSTRVKL